MLEKIQTYYQHKALQQFKDVRFLGFIVFTAIALMVTWISVSVIETNYELQKQVAKLEQENQLRQLENDNLKLQNDYYNSEQYLELTARRQFGKGQPGEKLLLVPRSVALTYAPEIPKETKAQVATPQIKRSFVQRNIEAWIDFFTHK